MYLLIKKTPHLTGNVIAPSSKSQSVRALLLALCANGQSALTNVLESDDTQAAKTICQQLGAKITQTADGAMVVNSPGLPLTSQAKQIYTSNSGITTRFILPLLGLRQDTSQPIILDCGEQMRSRPIHSLVAALSQLGMNINYLDQEGTCPLEVSGKLRGGTAQVAGITSQYLSALLIGLPCAELDSEISVEYLHERPYVEMTLQWLKEQGIRYTHQQRGHTDIYFIPGQQHYQPFTKVIPGDFSSASYLIAAGALIPGEVRIQGLDRADPQGDKRLLDILIAMGADIRITDEEIRIIGGKPLQGMTIDANDIPDLLPTLAVIATQAQGKTEIINVKQARIKETDRIHSMAEGLSCMGAHITEQADGLTVYPSQLQGASVKGYDDHRTVMSLALAGMLASSETRISDAEAINKTFPTFITVMQALGAKMELANADIR